MINPITQFLAELIVLKSVSIPMFIMFKIFNTNFSTSLLLYIPAILIVCLIYEIDNYNSCRDEWKKR